MIKIASLQYQYDFPKCFDDYAQKIAQLIAALAQQGIELIVFPEYAGFEIGAFADLEQCFRYAPLYLELFHELSIRHQVFICSGSQLIANNGNIYNRAHLFTPQGNVGHQDKCILTPYELNEGIVSAGQSLQVFDTMIGKIGICICYDIEFPSLAQMLVQAGATLLLVPSYTSSMHGFYRVFLSCRARALENQCYVVQSTLVGKTDIEIAYGASAILSPVDEGFPVDGVIIQGAMDRVEAVIGSIDLELLEKVRQTGQTRNYLDSSHLQKRLLSLELFDLK